MSALVTTVDRLIQNGYSPTRVLKLTALPQGVIFDRFRLQPARAEQWRVPALLTPREIAPIPDAAKKSFSEGQL